jgi:hypothetical protein
MGKAASRDFGFFSMKPQSLTPDYMHSPAPAASAEIR